MYLKKTELEQALRENMQSTLESYGGDSIAEDAICFCYEVHPRSRGEYIMTLKPHTLILGSPPLTRGIRQKRMNHNSTCRFTPAHAGNTLKEPLYFLTFPSPHPHISFNF